MELKDYQNAALEAFVRWREALTEAQAQADSDVEALRQIRPDIAIPDDLLNYPKAAWEGLVKSGEVPDSAGPYVSRTDEAGRPIPHVCFKVPTGGGKTLLAAAALERLHIQTGLVLWLTPTTAIYDQTKAALRNREHPYRQMLEQGSGGRVKFMEKDSPFTLADAANYLCVMLVSLPAANRNRNREFLRMFRTSERYPSFFSDGNEALADAELRFKYPDLDPISNQGLPVFRSLFNVFKMLRPVVVLDEAHKAYGRNLENNQEFARAVSRFDPRLVIELSATPNRSISNLLVDISGTDLKKAQMIKSPVQVASYPDADWQHTLNEAASRLDLLAAEARELESNEGRYVRPIGVVRVERTGNDQRDRDHIHAEDVRDYLVQNLAVPAESVRVKSSVNDELGRENLLSPYSPVRWIITKNALMEGWDCSFAYLLVMLDNTQAQRAITQLVGRVLRQPDARLTSREALNQCYVYCWNTEVSTAVNQVKNGLETEGLSGLTEEVMAAAANLRPISVLRREKFRGRNIFLPLVLHREGDNFAELDYQQHILPHIDWPSIEKLDSRGSTPRPVQRQTASVDVGEAPPIIYESQDLFIDKAVQVSWFARRISDITPNAWQASRIAKGMLTLLQSVGQTEEQIYDQRSQLAYDLREYMKNEIERQAEKVFGEKLRQGEITFDLEAGRLRYEMRETYEIVAGDNYGLMTGNDGHQVQLSLFEPIYIQQFDTTLERNFARYLDEQKALQWWHRIAVRQQGEYYLRGWKQERIWPDFIAMAGRNGAQPHVLVFETKGEHLKGNSDTEYKQKVLETLQNAFNAGSMTVKEGPAKGTFRLIFNENEFSEALAGVESVYSA